MCLPRHLHLWSLLLGLSFDVSSIILLQDHRSNKGDSAALIWGLHFLLCIIYPFPGDWFINSKTVQRELLYSTSLGLVFGVPSPRTVDLPVSLLEENGEADSSLITASFQLFQKVLTRNARDQPKGWGRGKLAHSPRSLSHSRTNWRSLQESSKLHQ